MSDNDKKNILLPKEFTGDTTQFKGWLNSWENYFDEKEITSAGSKVHYVLLKMDRASTTWAHNFQEDQEVPDSAAAKVYDSWTEFKKYFLATYKPVDIQNHTFNALAKLVTFYLRTDTTTSFFSCVTSLFVLPYLLHCSQYMLIFLFFYDVPSYIFIHILLPLFYHTCSSTSFSPLLEQ